MEVREKPFSYRLMPFSDTALLPKAVEPNIMIGSATVPLAAIARVAVTYGTQSTAVRRYCLPHSRRTGTYHTRVVNLVSLNCAY